MTTMKAAAYDLAKHLEPDVRDQLFDTDTPNDLPDVVRKLRDSHTPGWLYYYLNEVETPPNLGSGLVNLVGEETLEEVATRYATADNSIINLAQPASHDWMSDDPMAHVRTSYEDKREDISEAVMTAYTAAFGEELPVFTTSEFQDWFADGFLEDLNLLNWAVYEQKAAELGADNPTACVADWCVQRTRDYQLLELLATYRTRDQDIEAYLNEWRDQIQKKTKNDGYLDIESTDDPDIPFISPPLPARETDSDELREHLDDDASPF